VKKIGIIGGLAWPSTADYYRLLCTKTHQHFRLAGAPPPNPTPHMLIESLDMSAMRKLRGREGDEASWRDYDNVFRASFARLQQAGADFGLIASNTPHMRWKTITAGSGLPILSILDTTANAVRAVNGRRALVFGTPVTMRSPVYGEALSRYGVTSIGGISEGEIAAIEQLIDALYEEGIGHAPADILEIARRHIEDPASDIVCLACTELPLAFPAYRDSTHFQVDGITFVDTTVAHVEAAVEHALEG
jgi:aspartate racemase